MKNKLTLIFLFCVGVAFSQTPNLVNYQGVARDPAGVPIKNKTLSIKFELTQGTAQTLIFSEVQTITTNMMGLFTTQIGKTNSAGLNAINFNLGNLSLRTLIDTAAGANFIDLGTQKLVSVPYSMHAQAVPASYTNNVLTVGKSSFTLDQMPMPTITVVPGNSNVSVNGTSPNFTVSASPSLALLTANTLSITNGNSVTIAPSLLVTGTVLSVGPNTNTVGIPAVNISTQGVITSTQTANNYTLRVNPTNISMSNLAGAAFVNTTGVNNFQINVPSPHITTSSVTGAAAISTVSANQYNINIPPPHITASSLAGAAGVTTVSANNYVINIPPSNITVSSLNSAVAVTTVGVNNYNINIPPTSYSTGALISGPSTINITPTLTLNGSILSVGNLSNSINFSSVTPWRQAVNQVTLANINDNVGIGTSNPTFKLEVTGSGTLHTFSSTNLNAGLNTFAGVFDGGLLTRGKNNANNGFAFRAHNASNSPLFTIVNNGRVGIGSVNPNEALTVRTTANTGISVISGANNISNVAFGDSINPYRGNIRYDNVSNSFNFWTNNTDNRLFISNLGNVTIGSNLSNANNTVGKVLSVAATTVYSSNTAALELIGASLSLFTPIGKLDFNSVGVAGTGTNVAQIAAFRGGGADDGSMVFSTSKSGTLTNRMAITNDGRVGIGANATTPNASLTVVGTTRFADGTEAAGRVLTSDAIGNATWQDVVSKNTGFAAYQSSGQSVTSTWSQVLFQGEDFDDGNDFSGSAYVAPAAGVYEFNASVSWASGIPATSYAFVAFYKNGSPFKYKMSATTPQYNSNDISCTMKLNANDVITVWVVQFTGSPGSTYGAGNQYTFFSGFRVY